MVVVVWGWVACGLWAEPPPSVPPSIAAQEVAHALDDAVVRAGQGDEGAFRAWARAHDVFEAHVEPALRARHDRRIVAEVELQFSVVRAELARGAGTAEVEALNGRIAELLGRPSTAAPAGR